MAAKKNDFYKNAAKGLAADALLYKVDSVVHVEDKDDIWFWEPLLLRYRPGRYKFKPATTNERGNRTTGSTQCLKYKDYLSQRFFICIDSDLRNLFGENLSAQQGVLQTYTYSWENHCAFAPKLQELFAEKTGKGADFDFVAFLQSYSEIVYKPFLFMLYQEKNGLGAFNRDVFKQCISLQYRVGDELDNGSNLLRRLSDNLTNTIGDMIDNSDFNFDEESVFYTGKGVSIGNVYLYVRGHNLYDCLASIGRKLCEGTEADFEQNILQTALAFERYEEISKIRDDIYSLQNLRTRV